jgi:hypothetical protein
MILEGIVTTLTPQGAVHIAPMGPHVDAAMQTFLLRPYRTAQTYRNLKVVEAAILATRTAFLPRHDIDTEFRKLAGIVEKTGGEQEKRAFAFLRAHLARVGQARGTGSGAPLPGTPDDQGRPMGERTS